MTQAYLHMVIDEDSARLQTISTHKGMYKVNILMFVVKIAPGLWQKYMDRILSEHEGVQCFLDDIIIQGSSFEETMTRLRKVLMVLMEHNLRLNK